MVDLADTYQQITASQFPPPNETAEVNKKVRGPGSTLNLSFLHAIPLNRPTATSSEVAVGQVIRSQ